jgi:SH3 domain protein
LERPLKKIALTFLLLHCSVAWSGQKAWVTDKLETQIRSGPGMQYRILKMLATGAPLEIVNAAEEKGFTQVRMESGDLGWIMTRYLSTTPVACDQKALYEENANLKTELAALKSGKDNADKANQDLGAEAARLNTEVIAIRQDYANAVQIREERDQLQEKVIALEGELDSVKRAKQAQDASNKQDWFMIGAGVLFGGILLGLILPRLSWRKRSSWDSF